MQQRRGRFTSRPLWGPSLSWLGLSSSARGHFTLRGVASHHRRWFWSHRWVPGALKWLASALPPSPARGLRLPQKGCGGPTGHLQPRSGPQDHPVWLRTMLGYRMARSMRGDFGCTVQVRWGAQPPPGQRTPPHKHGPQPLSLEAPRHVPNASCLLAPTSRRTGCSVSALSLFPSPSVWIPCSPDQVTDRSLNVIPTGPC